MSSRIRTDIEGLRAVAVLLVLLYHLRVPGVGGGFSGVDVFFVISGFLITGLLLRELAATSRLDLAEFYARRARRLLPAALLVICCTVAAGWWILPGSQLRHLGHDGLGSVFYVVNWVFAHRAVDYLAEDASPSLLQHYWSLSIEEQFYLGWPVVILLVATLGRTRAGGARDEARALGDNDRLRVSLVVVLTAITLLSFGWALWLSESDPARAYFVTTTRVWELGVGALLAFLLRHARKLPYWAAEALALTGMMAIMVAAYWQHAEMAWPGVGTLVPVLGAAAVIAAGCSSDRTVVARLLGWGPLVWLGGLSYGIYLWHWPVVLLAGELWGEIGGAGRFGLGALAVGLAWLTKHAVEDPIRYSRQLTVYPHRNLIAAVVAMLLTASVAGAMLASRPSLGAGPELTGSRTGPATLVEDVSAVPWRLIAEPATAFTRSGALVPDPDLAPEDIPVYYDHGCQIEQGVAEPRFDCVYGVPTSSTEVLLLGDSKMGQWFSAFDAIAVRENWRLTAYLKSACPFTVAGAEKEDCTRFGESVLDHVLGQGHPPTLAVLSTGAARTPALEEGMIEAVSQLQRAGTHVVIMQDNDYPPGSQYPCAAEHRASLDDCEFAASEPSSAALLSAVAEATGSPVMDLQTWICPVEGACPVAIGGVLLWRQGSHLTDSWARGMTPFIYRELSLLGVTQAGPRDIQITDVPRRAHD